MVFVKIHVSTAIFLSGLIFFAAVYHADNGRTCLFESRNDWTHPQITPRIKKVQVHLGMRD